MIIFGISIGTRRTGICIMKDGALIRAQVHNYMSPWSDEKLNKMIDQYRAYIQKYNVKGIIIKVPPISNHSPEIRIIMEKISLIAKQYGCAFDFITKKELKAATNTNATEELIIRTVRLYPELKGFYERGKNSYPHFQRLYEAVLSARIYEERMRITE